MRSSPCPFVLRGALAALALALAAAPVLAQPPSEPLPAYEPDAAVPREQVPDVYKWDLTQLFPSDEAFLAGLVELAGELPRLAAFEGKLDSGATLLQALETYFDLHDRVNRATLYANLQMNANLADDERKAMNQRAQTLLNDLQGTAGFLRAGILAPDEQSMARMYEAEPGLERYRPYLENLQRRRARLLGPEAERVLALAGDNLWAEIDLNEIPSPLEEAFGAILTDIPWPKVHDEDGNEVQLTLANVSRFRASKNRDVRREAVTAFLGTIHQFRHALAATLAGQFELDVAFARARGYETALEAYLDKDDLDVAVHDNLIATVNANLEPLHRYVQLRQRVLGLDAVHLYDLYVPMVADVDVDIPYAEASATVIEALRPLGPRYGEVLAHGLDPRNGWIDVYPSLHKESGAFSSSVYGRHPYVKMNYQDSLDDMSTLAHEYGHALHSQLAMEAQPYPTYRYPAFLAEIASTCNEVLLQDHLLAQTQDRARRAYLLNERLESIRTTIYRQTMFSEFERLAHGFVEAGTPVTAELLRQTYGDLVKKYYGPAFAMDEHDDVEWAYIPHFYYKYYVYSYATGLMSGIAIAERVREEGQPAVDAYLGMLAGGSSKPPLELLRGAGVDLTRPEALAAAFATFRETVDELETLLLGEANPRR